MLLKELISPIRVFDVLDFDVDIALLQGDLKRAYASEYQADEYLHRLSKLNLLRQNLSENDRLKLTDIKQLAYYAGDIGEDELLKGLISTTVDIHNKLDALKPTRLRLVSEYHLEYKGGWAVTRVDARPFEQKSALIASGKHIDFRQIARKFRELPDNLYTPELNALILGVANSIKDAWSHVKSFKLIVHHTLIKCYAGQVSTNSPEGIHQDGMDYIVSALVVERRGVNGGKSIIYGSDKMTPIFEMELKAGQGILQPDLGTDLWHEVTPLTLENSIEDGFRSTIGFDIDLGINRHI